MIQQLFNPQLYFSNKANLPFTPGFAAVFINGALTSLVAIFSLVGVRYLINSPDTTVTDVSLITITSPLYVSFFLWSVITLIFYVIIRLSGKSTITIGSIVNITGIGYYPLAIVSAVELVFGIGLINIGLPSEPPESVYAIVAGSFGVGPAILMALIHIVGIIWASYIWYSGISEFAQISRVRSLLCTALAFGLLALEFAFFTMV